MKLRDGVKATPMMGASMIGPAKLFNWLLNVIIPSPQAQMFSETNMKEENGEFTDIINNFILKYSLLSQPQNYTMFNLTSWMEITTKYDFQYRPIPVFGTHKEFHIPFTPPGGKGTMRFDAAAPNLTDDPIDFEGPFVASYDKVSSESDPFTLEEMLGASTDNIGINPALTGLINGLVEGLGDVPITIDIPFTADSKRKMALTGKFSSF